MEFPAVVTVTQVKWQQLVPVSMEAYADIFGIWPVDAGEEMAGEGWAPYTHRSPSTDLPPRDLTTLSDHGHL